MNLNRIIFEEFSASALAPSHYDELLKQGWRHAGTHFYRYNVAFHKGTLTEVIPLRVPLAAFKFSKGQRRNLKRNAHFEASIDPVNITREVENLFEKHKLRFEENVPESIFDFITPQPSLEPAKCWQLSLYQDSRIIACSFFDVGKESLSSIYGMYDPEFDKHGLGIYTMLLEIEHAQQTGRSFYYHGYCYSCPSFYDYKKRFRPLERFCWSKGWEMWEPTE